MSKPLSLRGFADKFKGKKADTPPPEAVVSGPSKQEDGLHVVYDSSKDGPDPHVEPEIDVVAVHGLNFKNHSDHAMSTWTGSDGKTLWLRDFLPQRLPRPSRVMIFSFNSSPAFNANAIKLDDHSRALLQWLHIKRKSCPNRPLVFVCHSLGGLVVKQALVEDSLKRKNAQIVEATRLLVFFATPHRGGNLASVGDVAAKIMTTITAKPRNDLVEALKASSNEAVKRLEQSRYLYDDILVVSFFENEPYGIAGTIVEKHSATLDLPPNRERQIPMPADHSMICKFDTASGSAELSIETIVSELKRVLEIPGLPSSGSILLSTTGARSTELSSSKRSDINQHWCVPRPVNRLFTGRKEIIEHIKVALAPNLASDMQKVFVITGQGGMGKSEIALKVANELRNQFWGIFWVDVDSESTAKAGYQSVAKALGSSSQDMDDIKRQLSNLTKPWLLILDNADDPKMDYLDYFPSGNRGSVLMTSRNPECNGYSSVGFEDLYGLDLENSVDLLLQSTKTSNSPEHKFAAEEVVRFLGFHTLALIQAGAYISKGYCSLGNYASEFQKNSKRVMETGGEQAKSRYKNVYATFEVSAQRLESSDEEESKDALSLLHLLANFHYSGLPLRLFERAWDSIQYAREIPAGEGNIHDLSRWHLNHLPAFMNAGAEDWDPFRLSRAVDLLQSLALVSKGESNGLSMVSMHPLAHSWAWKRQERISDESWLSAGCVLALSCKGQGHCDPYWYQLKAQLPSFLANRLNSSNERFPTMQLAQIFMFCCFLSRNLRMDVMLEQLLGITFDLVKQDEDVPSQAYLSLYESRAVCLGYMGHISERVQLLVSMVGILARTEPEDSADLLGLQHMLAMAYRSNGHIQEAISLLEHVVKVREALAENHPERLVSQHALASAYREDGRVQEAIELLQHIVKVQEALAVDHPNRLGWQHGLAGAYYEDGRLKDAISLSEGVVRIMQRTLAENHPDLLSSQNNLSLYYFKAGKRDRGIKLLEHVVRVRQSSLREDHPKRIGSEKMLAKFYKKLEPLS